jgi:hypothetical protein
VSLPRSAKQDKAAPCTNTRPDFALLRPNTVMPVSGAVLYFPDSMPPSLPGRRSHKLAACHFWYTICKKLPEIVIELDDEVPFMNEISAITF